MSLVKSKTLRRGVVVTIVLLLVAGGVWFYAYSSIKAGKGETYEGPISAQLTSMTIEEARHLKRKFRVVESYNHLVKHGGTSKSATRSVGECYTDTAHNWAGHQAMMNAIEVWVQFHWCNKKSNPTQIAKATVQAVRTDTCCLLNPWSFDKKETSGGRYWDNVAYSEIARKVVYVTFQQKLGPLGLFHNTMYFDCRLNASHGWIRCHDDLGNDAPSWNPTW